MKDLVQERGRGTPWRLIGWGGAVALLSVPLIAMQFTSEVDWTASDFIFMGALFAIIGGLFELGVRASTDRPYRLGLGLALLGMFLTIWVNLAVGIVRSEDNPNNGLFFAALLMGVGGAVGAKMKAQGMARAMLATAAAVVLAFILAESGLRDEPMVHPIVEAAGTSIFVMLFLASAWLFRRAAQSSSSS